jgi:hypothetical protein
MNIEQIKELINDNAPWYQRIELAPGIFTTDLPDSWFNDAAWDNVMDDVGIEDASKYRPIPKWKHIKNFMPDINGHIVLEIGCNCGFFSVEFSKKAEKVFGIDVSETWLNKARKVKEVLSIDNIYFIHSDFLLFNNLRTDYLEKISYINFFNSNNLNLSFERKIVDTIFCSTVIDHVYFPFLFIYKMLFNSKKYVILDTPVIDKWEPTDKFNHNQFLHIDGPADNSHHGFTATESFWRFLLKRLNVNDEMVVYNRYGENNLCIVINTVNWEPLHLGC